MYRRSNDTPQKRKSARQQSDKETLDWFRLDNAATVFSLVTSARIPCMFRLAFTLNEAINIQQLQQALENIIKRFPYYNVNLRPGLFWFYWEQNLATPKVEVEQQYPCQKLPITKKGVFPFRVRAYKNRIAVEFHHSITDGTGGLTFLKALVVEYFRLKGYEPRDWLDVFKATEKVDPEEYEDAFKRNYQKAVPSAKSPSKAFHLPYKLEPKGIYHVIQGKMPVKKVLTKAKALNLTLTEYLIAIYLDSLQEIVFALPKKLRQKHLRPIRLQVPVNLRRIYPSKTMRNFSLYVTPEIDPRLGKHSFEEIVNQVYHYMRVEICDKFINQWVARNVRGELNPLLRMTPLILKRLFGKVIYNRLGEYLYSGVITNLGRIVLPEPVSDFVQEVDFIPAPSPVTKTGCAVASYKDTLFITFGRTIKESVVEKLFFTRLVKEGIEVKITSN
ncbi:MAG: hypothetical protein ACTSV6_06105 [Candidatus Heimdallarchaeota archaeon]